MFFTIPAEHGSLCRVTIKEDLPRRLPKGANVRLRDLDAEMGGVTVLLETTGGDGEAVDADVSVLLLGADGRVRSSDDLVFYNQPLALGGAVHLRDKIRSDTDDGAGVISVDLVTLELDDVPDEVERIVVSASLDPSTSMTFGDATALGMRVQRTADAADLVVFDIGDASSETALLFGEFYRRDGAWRVRAVGQGYSDGLPALVSDHGVEVAVEEAAGEGAAGSPSDRETPPAAASAGVAAGSDAEPGGQHADGKPAGESSLISVRRATRAPKLPADWDVTIPAEDGNDWQAARLFPVSGIGGKEEQEKRATSALLAVMCGVREFGRAVARRCGAPAGIVTTFIEVPFGQDEETYRPDGVLQVRWGKREWTGLVEVKTGDGLLNAEQIDHYVDIARARDYDAVITISNELTGAEFDHPVSVDRRKLRKVALTHVSWDQIRADALIAARHAGVADATQRWMLEEFIRYLTHPRAGTSGFTDMGQHWVRVREAVRAKTARSTERGIADVSHRFDELVEHVGLRLSGMLGVDVQAVVPRTAPDNVSRCQQLADSGELFGCLRIPGAVDLLILNANVRTDQVSVAITVPAPRGETRPLTRVNWLLRQLPDTASPNLLIEANLAGGRRESTAAQLAKLREQPELLVPDDQREIRSFTITHNASMGAKRAAGTGTLIHSLKTATNTFYADVVQHLRPWKPRS